jgi:transcriptional regulator with XRE-family HTH domain
MSKSQLVKKTKSTAWETSIFPRLTEIQQFYEIEGLTDAEVAKRLNVSVSTYDRSKRKKELQDIIVLTRGSLSANVTESLYQRCLRSESIETTTIENFDKAGELISTTSTTKTKTIPGSVSAQLNWLYNRRPDLWAKTPETLIEGSVNIIFDKSDDGL